MAASSAINFIVNAVPNVSPKPKNRFLAGAAASQRPPGGRPASRYGVASGEQIRAAQVVGAIDPTSLFNKLIERRFETDVADSRRPTFPTAAASALPAACRLENK